MVRVKISPVKKSSGKRKVSNNDEKAHKLSFFSENDTVNTPKAFYAELNAEFNFNFDPCPVDPQWDGLAIDWKERNYVNPPYSEIGKWIKKGIEEMKKGNLSVFLVTARTNTNYWRDYVYPYATEIRLFTMRLPFEGHKNPFPSCLAVIVFDPNRQKNRPETRCESYSYVSV